MASKAAAKRLSKEYVSMQKDPPPFIWASPDENDILIWNFLIRGPPDSVYRGGEYHGVIVFPSEYPFKPPGIKMLTPSGRFQPNKKICFSMSDYHPASWNPAWSVATILTGLLSFMVSDEMTTGSLMLTPQERQILAQRSHAWNINQPRFRQAFPDYSIPTMKDLPNMGEKERGIGSLQTAKATAAGPTEITTPTPTVPSHWASSLWRTIYDKWRWGAFLAFAVLISRLSSK